MFLRLVQMRVNPEKILELMKVYERIIIPTLKTTPGCVYAGLVQSMEDPDDGISITLWGKQDDALAYERSGRYVQALDAARPFFSDSSEWSVQLSVDLRPDFWQRPTEPQVKSFATEGSALQTSAVRPESADSVYLRILTLKVKPEKKLEFVDIYHGEIIPGLRKVEGCLDAYLAEGVRGDNELLSITIWRGLEHAKAYETSGQFEKLKEKVQHTFTSLARWKMALDEAPLPGTYGSATRAATSDDISIRTYSIVVGKALR